MNSEDLDRHITGNYGEDFFDEDENFEATGDTCHDEDGTLWPEHGRHCWWCVYNDDGRDQAQ